MTRSPVRADRALVFFFASSFAETVQAVGILWAAFALTDSGVVVGAVNAAAYLPGVVVGLLYRNRADSGDSARWLTRTNWALVLGSAVLTTVWIAAVTASILVVVFIAAQTLLSVVKMLNKAYVGRFVREQFDSAEARRLLERATSLGLIGGLVGGSLGGLLLDVGSAGWTFALAAIMYVVSLGAIRYAVGPRVQNRGPTSHQRIGPAPGRTDASRRLIWLVLVFSIPSSGALPYISTLTVPLSNDIAPGSGVFYAALTVVTALGGFVAGMALSAGKVTLDRVLSLALIGSAALCIGLREATWAPAVLLLVFLVAVLLTSHVISMQVLTNQVPAQGEVGKFTVLRNCVAGLAKGGFSLLAGWFIDVGGPAQCWLLLAAVLAVFGVGWHIVGRRCGGSSLVS